MSTLLSCSAVLCKTTIYLCLRANHLALVLNRTSKDNKGQHPRRNSTRAEDAIELPQVSLRGADAFHAPKNRAATRYSVTSVFFLQIRIQLLCLWS